MVGGRPICLSYFYIYSSVLLLWVCLLDVEASSCPSNIHKKVGDTVELPTCLPTEGVTVATWKHGDTLVADIDVPVIKNDHFKDRVSLNRTTWSLTLSRLTLQDSGDFKFSSGVNTEQRTTVIITLHVHEPIAKAPDLTFNSTWHSLNKSCTVSLECRSTSDSSVNYSWSVRNRSFSDSRLQYNYRPEDGETTFTCTITNYISEKSASKKVKCSNNTSPQEKEPNFVLILSVAGGGCLLIVIIVGIAVGVCHCKQRRAGSDSNELTVYADVNDFAIDNGTSTMKPCSVYETIDKRTNPVRAGPQTVYDKIQLSRVRKPSVSPYQEVS